MRWLFGIYIHVYIYIYIYIQVILHLHIYSHDNNTCMCHWDIERHHVKSTPHQRRIRSILLIASVLFSSQHI